MHYVVAEHRTGAEGSDQWAPAGEPVIPNFPTGARGTFLGARSFRPVPYGKVAELPELDIDELAAVLKARFKGLPGTLLDTYVVETARFAMDVPVGTIVQPYLDEKGEELRVRVVEVPRNDAGVNVEDLYILWDRQPIPEEFR